MKRDKKARQIQPQVGMTDNMRFEYLHRAATAQYGLAWLDINMRMKDGAMNLVDPQANKWLLSVLAYKACQYFRPKEPHHLGILNHMERQSKYALERIRDACVHDYYHDEAVGAAKRAAHYGALILKAFELLREESALEPVAR